MSAADDFPPGGPESKARLSTLLRILLLVSLALNMFFLGAGVVLLGRSMSGGPSRGPGSFLQHMMHEELPGPGMMLRALPPESRKRVEEQIGPDRDAMRQAILSAKKARREAYGALSAQPFSAAAFQQKLDAAEVADLAAVRAVHKVLSAATAALTPEERADLVAALNARKSDRPQPPDDGTPDRPPPPQP
jgi:uncharacterized membrane protein